MNKRKLLKGIGAGSLWATPSIATILTPMHAQATPMPQQCPIIQDFTTPGEFTVTVPSCATRMTVEVAGGSSGRAVSFNSAPTDVGRGSLVSATINVTAGETLTVIVAENGSNSINRSPSEVSTGATIGYGRGGNGGILPFNGGVFQIGAGGGGGSAILRGSQPLVVAGGGGGGGWRNTVGTNGDTDGAIGGATAGQNGVGGVGGATLPFRPEFNGVPGGDAGGARDGGNGSNGLVAGVFAVLPGGGGGGGFGGGGGGGSDNLQARPGGGGGSMFTGSGNIIAGGAPEGPGSVSITFE